MRVEISVRVRTCVGILPVRDPYLPLTTRAPAPASTIGSDGAGGYAAKFGGAAAGAPAETLPGFKPKPAPPKPQKNLLELLLDWVGTIFPYQITCVKKR